ncbi:pentapeptide repeat-containing protein [Pseudonocardia parietis]|uniref:Syndecan 1 n=1 Tax=Pseudonocardia parietis TaxID=570936 RepID=A0ABS4W1V8_9PSEU|nr:pentapeptide repeat-containing protein [Pseudonocardia parietis]MBP2370182.1 syndecan 1 [Pseudonocardia parietis]
MTSDLGHRAGSATTAELRTAAALRWQRPLLTAELAGYACVRAVADGDDLRWVQAAGWLLDGHAAGGDARDVATAVLAGLTGSGRADPAVPAVPGRPPGAALLARPEAARLRVELATVAQVDGELETARALVADLPDDSPGEEPGLLRLDRLAVQVRCALAGQADDDLDRLRREVESCGAGFGSDVSAFADLVAGSVHRARREHDLAVERALRGLAKLGWTPEHPESRPLSAHLAAALLSQWITALLDAGRSPAEAVRAASAQPDVVDAGRQGVLLRLTLARADPGAADHAARALAEAAAGAGSSGVPGLVAACRTAQSELHEGAGRYREALEAMRSAAEADQLDRARARRFRHAVAAALPVAGIDTATRSRSEHRHSPVRRRATGAAQHDTARAPATAPDETVPDAAASDAAASLPRRATSLPRTTNGHAAPTDVGGRGSMGKGAVGPDDVGGAVGRHESAEAGIRSRRGARSTEATGDPAGPARTVLGESAGTTVPAAGPARPDTARVEQPDVARDRDRVSDVDETSAIDPDDPLGVSGMLTGDHVGDLTPVQNDVVGASGVGDGGTGGDLLAWAGRSWSGTVGVPGAGTPGSGSPLADALLAELRNDGRDGRAGQLVAGRSGPVNDSAVNDRVLNDSAENNGAGYKGAGSGDARQSDAEHELAAGADLGRAGSGRADLGRTGLGRADLGRADFDRADSDRADANRADSDRVDASRADTSRADFDRPGSGGDGTGGSGIGGAGIGRDLLGRNRLVARKDTLPLTDSRSSDRSILVDVVDPSGEPMPGHLVAGALDEIAARSRRLVPPSGTTDTGDTAVRITLPDADRVTVLLWARSLATHLADRVHRGGLPVGAALRLRCVGPHGAEGDEIVRELAGPDEVPPPVAPDVPPERAGGARRRAGRTSRPATDASRAAKDASRAAKDASRSDADAPWSAVNAVGVPARDRGDDSTGVADADDAERARPGAVAGPAMAAALHLPSPDTDRSRAGRRRATDGEVSPLLAAGIDVRPGSGGRRRSDAAPRSGDTDAPAAGHPDEPGGGLRNGAGEAGVGPTTPDDTGTDRRLADMLRTHLDLSESRDGTGTPRDDSGRAGRPVAWSSVSEGDGPAALPKRNGRRSGSARRPDGAGDATRADVPGSTTTGADVWTVRSARADTPRDTAPDREPVTDARRAGTGATAATVAVTDSAGDGSTGASSEQHADGVTDRPGTGTSSPSDDGSATPGDPNAIPEGMGLADLLAGALAAYREI